LTYFSPIFGTNEDFPLITADADSLNLLQKKKKKKTLKSEPSGKADTEKKERKKRSADPGFMRVKLSDTDSEFEEEKAKYVKA
jgi:protein required for attachment to host cells